MTVACALLLSLEAGHLPATLQQRTSRVCLSTPCSSPGGKAHIRALRLHAATAVPTLAKLGTLLVLQIVELVPADVEAMSSAQVSRLCAALLPDSWLTTPQEVRTLRTPEMRKPCVSRLPQSYGLQG
jgi:hypothetical protein